MSRSPLRVAIIGYGLAGRVFHAPLVAAEPDMRIAAIVTSDPERRAAARGRPPGARVVESADRLWESPGDLDLVVVGAPNRAHVPLARAAIAAGIAVVVDKPFAPTAASGRALVEEAEAAGVMLDGLPEPPLGRRLPHGAAPGPRGGRRRRSPASSRVSTDGAPRSPTAGARGPASRRRAASWPTSAATSSTRRSCSSARRCRSTPKSTCAVPGPSSMTTCSCRSSTRAAERSHLGASMIEASPGPRMRLLGLGAPTRSTGWTGRRTRLAAGAHPGETGWGRMPAESWGRLSDGASTRPVETEAGDYPAFYAGRRAQPEGRRPTAGGPPRLRDRAGDHRGGAGGRGALTGARSARSGRSLGVEGGREREDPADPVEALHVALDRRDPGAFAGPPAARDVAGGLAAEARGRLGGRPDRDQLARVRDLRARARTTRTRRAARPGRRRRRRSGRGARPRRCRTPGRRADRRPRATRPPRRGRRPAGSRRAACRPSGRRTCRRRRAGTACARPRGTAVPRRRWRRPRPLGRCPATRRSGRWRACS